MRLIRSVLVLSLSIVPFSNTDAEENLPVLCKQSFDTPVEGVQSIEGEVGRAAGFDGVDDFVSLGDFGRCDRVEIEFRMRAENIEHADEWQGLVTSEAPWRLGAMHLATRAGRIEWYLHQGGSCRSRLASGALENDRWYTVRLIADVPGRSAELYVDGERVDKDAISPVVRSIDLSKMTVGREGPTRHFKGAIDEVVIRGREAPPFVSDDPRHITRGHELPDESYCDQPYIVVLDDGTWVCCMTTGAGKEGQGGQHIVATRSADQGKTWSKLYDIEPSCDVSASWVVPLLTPYGRIYAFYTYNGDRVRLGRDDTHGWYAYKYSDDGGQTWSDRYRIPIRRTACDQLEKDGQVVQMFWGICKPQIVGDEVFFAFTKLGKYFLAEGEGWVVASDNLLIERDPEKIRWRLLPDGDHGIRHPQYGSIQEEHNLVPLSDEGSLYCVYRTTLGFPAISISRDGGRTWPEPRPMPYAGGRTIRNPRACPKLWKCKNGKYLFWFHNNGGLSFSGRNPAWIAGGVERDGTICWSQPEILIYDDNPGLRMSYPDLVEIDGRYWVTETQKEIARVHEIDASLLEGLWQQVEATIDPQANIAEVTRRGLVLETAEREATLQTKLDIAVDGGLSLDFRLDASGLEPGDVLIDNRDDAGRGIFVAMSENQTVMLEATDGRSTVRWNTDADTITEGEHQVIFIIDADPRIVMSVVDGQICDGAGQRTYGWGRFDCPPCDVSGKGKFHISSSVKDLRVYNRYLRVSEAVLNQLADR